MLGYNSRETLQDATYDVQTQQISSPERSIETHVYRNGKIVATVRTYYSQDAPVDSLEERMSQQHEEVCGKVREGTYELVFLWISRGIIAFESLDYAQALECFESVLAIDETHAEVNAYLNKIQACLEKDSTNRRKVLDGYRKQIEALEQSGRIMEAGRKRAVLTRICSAQRSSGQAPRKRKEGRTVRPAGLDFLGDLLRMARETLIPALADMMPASLRERLVPKIKNDLIRWVREEMVPRVKEEWLPWLREKVLPILRENLFSRYALVTSSAVILLVLSGLIAADFQIELDPAYHVSLGKEYLEGNRIGPARNLFYGILRQDPGCQEALEGFWETVSREGDYPKAGELLQALVENRDSSPQVYFYLAEAQRLSSRCEQALPFYKEAAAKGYPEVPCKIGMGLCLVDQQNLAAAIDLWEDLLKRGFEDYRVEYCLGAAYHASGRLGSASLHYSKALQARPESGPIYRALGHCLHGMHQQERAEQLWEKAASLASEGGTPEPCPGYPEIDPGSQQVSLRRLNVCFPFPLI
jgi:tetratricopeptide (TPR) repeat protein